MIRTRRDEALEFFGSVFPEVPETMRLILCAKRETSMSWTATTSAEEAATAAVDREWPYFACALHDPNLIEPGSRGTKASSAAVRALWVDVDLVTDARPIERPPDKESALAVIDALPLRPSIVVDSGGGLHVYWLLRDLVMFGDGEQRQDFDLRSRGWQQLIRDRFCERGWKLDRTASLAQLLRVPGTLNAKYGKLVKTIRLEDELYDLDDFAEWKQQRRQRGESKDPATIASENGSHRGEWSHRQFRLRRYGEEALKRAVKAVGKSAVGERNHTLNAAGYSLGRLVGAGVLSRGDAEEGLYAAAFEAGLDHGEVEATCRSGLDAGQQDPHDPDELLGNGGEPRFPNTTDTGNAERMARLHGDDIHYCHPWRKWLVWDGSSWRKDDTGAIQGKAKSTVQRIYREASNCDDDDVRKTIVSWGKRSESHQRRTAMIELAKSEPGIPVLPAALDRDHWLLNVQNGTIDLRTGQFRSHSRDDLQTRISPTLYNPQATCPKWHGFLKQVLPAKELRDFIQRAIGYSITGDASEDVLFFCHGVGANGKSTLFEVVQGILGRDYSIKCARNLLNFRQHSDHPTELADLFGIRFALANEVQSGSKLDEALVKDLTGGDRIRARRMREDFWEFDPTHKFWIAGNHKPRIQGVDDGIWRRLLLVPFTVQIAKDDQDPGLPTKLLGESSGILNWAITGCLKWQQDGLHPPEKVMAATKSYRQDEDRLGPFIESRCRVLPGAEVSSKFLYDDYTKWCGNNGEEPVALTTFGIMLRERGFERKKSNTIKYIGIRLLNADEQLEKTELTRRPEEGV